MYNNYTVSETVGLYGSMMKFSLIKHQLILGVSQSLWGPWKFGSFIRVSLILRETPTSI